jgi:hypothetical protein
MSLIVEVGMAQWLGARLAVLLVCGLIPGWCEKRFLLVFAILIRGMDKIALSRGK